MPGFLSRSSPRGGLNSIHASLNAGPFGSRGYIEPLPSPFTTGTVSASTRSSTVSGLSAKLGLGRGSHQEHDRLYLPDLLGRLDHSVQHQIRPQGCGHYWCGSPGALWRCDSRAAVADRVVYQALSSVKAVELQYDPILQFQRVTQYP